MSIIECVKCGDLVFLRKCLAAGADANTMTPEGDSLLHLAIASWDTNNRPLETALILLQHGANPNGMIHDDVSLVLCAVFNAQPEVVKVLLEYGANPNDICDAGEMLFDAVEFDYRYETYDLALPEEPEEADRRSSRAWCEMLERFAKKYRREPPLALRYLLEHGARGVLDESPD